MAVAAADRANKGCTNGILVDSSLFVGRFDELLLSSNLFCLALASSGCTNGCCWLAGAGLLAEDDCSCACARKSGFG